MEVEEKLSKLKVIVSKLESVVVAFSGGVDSTLVAKVCYDTLKDNSMAVTARSETYPDFEFKESQELAREIGIKHMVVDTSELAIEGFANNPPERCYFCKTELFGKLKEIAKEHGFLYVADGANLDDTQEFRPGLKASKELNVRSPLKEAGLAKEDIRKVSKLLNLPNWNKPAYACLSSRFPYGQSITEEKISMVSKAEKYLREALQILPLDPVINDHYADTLWMLKKDMQARYYWSHVLSLENSEKKLKDSVSKKIIFGINKKL